MIMRKPSIHISEPDLSNILKSILEDDLGKVKDTFYDNLAKEILLRSRKYSLTNRKLLATNQKTKQKVNKLQLSELEDAQLFSKLITAIRRQMKHRGIPIYKVGSRDWLLIKEATKLALDFCNEFGLSKKEGFTQYIKIGLSKMNKFGLPKFNAMQQGISEYYGATLELKEDRSPRLTERAYIVYDSIVREKTGMGFDYRQIPEKYVYFLKAKEEALRFNVSVEIYIQAQFAGLAWKNGIPDPIQLIGIKAEEKLKKYMFENNIKINNTFKSNIDVSKLKRLK